MFELPIFLLITSTLVLIHTVFSSFIKQTFFITGIQWFFLTGVILAAAGLSPFTDLQEPGFQYAVREITRYIIAIQLISSALYLPSGFFRANAWQIFYLILVVLPLSWAFSWLIAYVFFGNQISILVQLAISICLAPTDPVIISSIVRGKFAESRLPSSLRDILIMESGLNDGGAYPFVYIPIFLLLELSFVDWILEVVLLHVIVVIIMAMITGYILGKILNYCRNHNLIDIESLWFVILPVTILVLNIMESFGGDGILAVFIAGLVFDDVDEVSILQIESKASDILDSIASVLYGVFLGLIMPWSQYAQYGIGNLIGFAIIVLLFRRILFIFPISRCIFCHLTEQESNLLNGIGLSVFGPVAVSALFYASIFYLETGIIEPFHFLTFVSFISIFLHGSLSIGFAYLYPWAVHRQQHQQQR